MKCKYCEAELASWGGFCPVCGKDNTAEEEIELTPESLPEADAPGKDAAAEVEAVEEETDEPSAKLKKARRIAAMSGCVALLAILATVLFFGIRGGWDVGALFSWMQSRDEEENRENNINYSDSYTVTDVFAMAKKDLTVATMDDMALTNAQLQIYYWNGVYNFLNENYYYLSYIGFDYSKPLNEQTCYFDSTLSWQQYFLKSAIDTWHSNAALAKLARENGFTMPEEYRTELDGMEESLQASADEGGYESLDAMVQESFGVSVTFADYQEYMEVYYLGYAYFEALYNEIDPTQEDIEAYFTANEEELIGQGVKKDGTYTVDVRHILVMIDNIAAEMEKDDASADAQAEGGETAEEEDAFTEEQWAACLAAAQKIYDEWLAGDQTEEHFGELANQYSHDQDGKVTNGGIYTFVKEGDMVEDFNGWCFAEGRQPGDHGIVKSKFGYHIMYFVGSEETWITQTRSAYIAEKSTEIVDAALSKYTVTVDYTKIALTDMEL